MKRRRLLIALGVGLAVLVAVSAVWVLTPRGPYIDQAHLDRIKPGMRRDEVEAILGRPPGRYRHGRPVPRVVPQLGPEDDLDWSNDDAMIWVAFDEDGKVTKSGIVLISEESAFEHFTEFLHRLLP